MPFDCVDVPHGPVDVLELATAKVSSACLKGFSFGLSTVLIQVMYLAGRVMLGCP